MMQLQSSADINKNISNDAWMMETLSIVESLGLPDWYIGAGFVRNKIWDILHDYTRRTPLDDIDVIYFDPSNISVEREREIEEELRTVDAERPWSVKNQARMHLRNGDNPYVSSVDAFSRWPETATCIGVKLIDGKVVIEAPYGVKDLLNLIVCPSPAFEHKMDIYRSRIVSKNWASKWPKLQIITDVSSV